MVGMGKEVKVKGEDVLLGASMVNICPLVVIVFVVLAGVEDVLAVPGLRFMFYYQGLAIWVTFVAVLLLSIGMIITKRERKERKSGKVYFALALSIVPVAVNLYFLFTAGMSV